MKDKLLALPFFVLPLLYIPIFYFSFTNLTLFIWFAGGVLLGSSFSWLDKKFLSKYYLEVDKQSLPQPPYISRSLIFLITYAILGIFMLTSSGSSLGMGIILGIGLMLTWEVLIVNRSKKSIQEVITSGSERLNPQELNRLGWVIIAYFVILSILVFL